MKAAFKIVIDDFAGVVVTEPTDRRPANDNAPNTVVAVGIRGAVSRMKRNPVCVCARIEEMASAGLMVGLFRCPLHG